MIRYPFFEEGTTIGVTAPSSGVKEPLHELVKEAIGRLEVKGYRVVCGETVWTQEKAKSAPALVRAAELNSLLQDEEIGLIFPPWGGELLIEIVDRIEYDLIRPKWILGYSDPHRGRLIRIRPSHIYQISAVRCGDSGGESNGKQRYPAFDWDAVRRCALEQGESILVKPFVHHNLYMSAYTVTHVIKYGGGIEDDWYSSPELDKLTIHIPESDLIRTRDHY